MKLRHRITGEIHYVVKCRGCWERVDSPLDFNQFKVLAVIFIVYRRFFFAHRKWSTNMAQMRWSRLSWYGPIFNPVGGRAMSQLKRKKGI
jgi:hypothetical protein